jgi:hypothetical protein
MPAFKYTDEQWQSILAELEPLPNFAKYGSETVRELHEHHVTGWHHIDPKRVQETVRVSRSITVAVGIFRKVLKTDAGQELLTRDPRFWNELARLEAQALQWQISARPEGRKNKNAHRDRLLSSFVAIWVECGGEIRTSNTPPPDVKPTGPLIRYLTAAARPAGIQMSDSSAQEFIRESSRLARETTGTQSVDEAHAVLREWVNSRHKPENS